MKNEVSVPVIVTVVIVAVLLLGLIGWKVLGGGGHVDAATLAAAKARKMKKDGGD